MDLYLDRLSGELAEFSAGKGIVQVVLQIRIWFFQRLKCDYATIRLLCVIIRLSWRACFAIQCLAIDKMLYTP